MNFEAAIVIVIVAAAAAYIVARLRPRKRSQASGCDTCSSSAARRDDYI